MTNTRILITNPDWIADKSLTLCDIRVYGAIALYANTTTHKCFPKQKTIAAKLETSITAVSRSVQKLRKKGYISIEAKLDKRGLKLQNSYKVNYESIEKKAELITADNSEVETTIVDNTRFITPDNSELITADKLYNTLTTLTNITTLTHQDTILYKQSDIVKNDISKQDLLFHGYEPIVIKPIVKKRRSLSSCVEYVDTISRALRKNIKKKICAHLNQLQFNFGDHNSNLKSLLDWPDRNNDLQIIANKFKDFNALSIINEAVFENKEDIYILQDELKNNDDSLSNIEFMEVNLTAQNIMESKWGDRAAKFFTNNLGKSLDKMLSVTHYIKSTSNAKEAYIDSLKPYSLYAASRAITHWQENEKKGPAPVELAELAKCYHEIGTVCYSNLNYLNSFNLDSNLTLN